MDIYLGFIKLTSKKAYLQLIGYRQVHPVYKWLWKSYCQPRRKFFSGTCWRTNSTLSELLRRKTVELESYNCALCHQDSDETLMHLFFHCPFAMSCWNALGLAPFVQSELLQTISVFGDLIHQPFFMEIIISMCWAIWTARNDLIFRNLQHSVGSVENYYLMLN